MFSECTMLTIAHRLHTIIDSDRILVMERGEVVEFDEPHILLQDQFSSFSRLTNETNPETASKLQKEAEKCFHMRKRKP